MAQAAFGAVRARRGWDDRQQICISQWRRGDPVTQDAELLFYDNSGSLVAVANGNGPGGTSSVLDFIIPGGQGGNWTAEVAGGPGADPANNHFKYDLEINGATGTGPVVPK